MEAKQLYPQGQYEEMTRGHGELSMAERIADGMMLKNFCLQQLGVKGTRVIMALYTVPAGNLAKRKHDNIITLGQWLHVETGRDRWLLTDAAKEWAGVPPRHNQVWWARHEGRSRRAIYRWWKSKDPADKSAHYLLNLWENAALNKISIALAEENLIGSL
jgi:hypothetical protein